MLGAGPPNLGALRGARSRARGSKPHSMKVSAQADQLRALQPSELGKRLVSIGVVADVQYADINDGASFHGVPRYYRNALVGLQRAADAWREAGVDCVIHMGDILDGFQPKEDSEAALTAVLQPLEELGTPHWHMLGNHCLYNLPRARLNEWLGIPGAHEGTSYYSFEPHPRWRIIVLDGYDVSVLGWPEGHPLHEEAKLILNERNPNKSNFNSPEGLEGEARRFVMFGGGASPRQLEWLQLELEQTRACGQRAIVCGHLPLFPGTCPPACLLWNYEQVLQLLQSSGVVAATVAGHSHQNGWLLDEEHGIHHVVLPGVIETPPDRDCYGFLDLHEHGLALRGVDTMLSMFAAVAAPAAAVGERSAAPAAAATEAANL